MLEELMLGDQTNHSKVTFKEVSEFKAVKIKQANPTNDSDMIIGY